MELRDKIDLVKSEKAFKKLDDKGARQKRIKELRTLREDAEAETKILKAAFDGAMKTIESTGGFYKGEY